MEFQIIKHPEESNAIKLSGRLDVAGAGVAQFGLQPQAEKSSRLTGLDKIFQIAPGRAKAGRLLKERIN